MAEQMQTDSKETQIIIRELKRVLANNIKGDVVEFGCYSGATSIHLAKTITGRTNVSLYVYDSFEGLPEKSSFDSSSLGFQFKTGELAVSKKQFIKNIQKAGVFMPIITKAWFSDLSDRDLPTKVAFAYLDGDYYQSIKESLKLIEKSTSRGSTIVVDDYYNESLPGVKKAVDEWMSKKQIKFKIEKSLGILYL